jgi:hypothetical protein
MEILERKFDFVLCHLGGREAGSVFRVHDPADNLNLEAFRAAFPKYRI